MSRLPLVQVLRALAALAVAMLHIQHEAGLLPGGSTQAFAGIAGLPWEAGVDVFFVISGFIMVYASRELFAQPGAPRMFLARRLARIVPLYWLTTLVYLGVALASPSLLNSALLSPGFILASLLFIPMERPDGFVQPLYSLGWTLNCEMLFYLLFTLAIAFRRRLAVALVGGALVLGVFVGQLAYWPQPFRFWSNPIVLEFALGLLLGTARLEGLRLSGLLRLAVAAAGLALFAWNPLPPYEVAAPLRPVSWGLPAALLVAAAGLGRERQIEGGPVTRLVLVLGDSSYALYLVHPFVIRGIREALRLTGLAAWTGPWAFVALALAATALAAVLVYRCVERPMTRRVRRWLE